MDMAVSPLQIPASTVLHFNFNVVTLELLIPRNPLRFFDKFTAHRKYVCSNQRGRGDAKGFTPPKICPGK